MAYGLRYRCGFSSLTQTGYADIYEDDYVAATEVLTTASDSVQIRYNWKGWDDPIIGISASFAIVNDKDDFFELLPLLTADERKYWIQIHRVAPSAVVLFEGFLNCEDNEQKYLHKQQIRLNASSYLSKLQYVNPAYIEVLERASFIDIIDACLVSTGANDNIMINCSLECNGYSGANRSIFSDAGVYKEVFWQNNIDRDSALDIVKKILSSFDCFIYWWNGHWWIERYADIWNVPQSYLEYTTGVSYGFTDTATPINTDVTTLDFVDLTKMETSQNISIIPGQRQVEFNMTHQSLLNLVVNNFEDATTIDFGDKPPLPDYRQWELYVGGGSPTYGWTPVLRGKPYNNIDKAVYRYNEEESSTGNPRIPAGLYTRFRITVLEDTVLNIKFKYGVPFALFPADQPEGYQFVIYWYLRNPVGNYYIVYNDGTEQWERVAATENTGMQVKGIDGAELDPDLLTFEVNISVPLQDVYDVGVWDGDQDFVLGIGQDHLLTFYGLLAEPIIAAYYGDFLVTVNAPVETNYISGSVNTSFLNKKTLDQPFFDVGNLAIKNGISTGTDLIERTTEWNDDINPSLTLELVEMRLRDKFLLYNKARQKITGSIQYTYFIRPFRMFTDSNQAGLYFVLVGYTYEPQQDRMNLILSEYDNTETINLI